MSDELVDDVAGEWVRRALGPWAARRRRYALAKWRRERSVRLDAAGARYCGAPLGDYVNVSHTDQGATHVSGVKRCGSVWACPDCAPKVRSDRARDIAAAVEAAQFLGLEVWFVTATVPHKMGESLGDVVDRVQGMWSDVWTGRRGVELRDRIGQVGSIRVLEVTYGRSGWHPHVHALLFCRPGEMHVPAVAGAWRDRFRAHGFRYRRGISLDVRPLSEVGGIGAYLGKVEQSWGAGLELARADLKGSGSGITQAQLLELATTGEAKWVARWCEFERTMKGKRFCVWSSRRVEDTDRDCGYRIVGLRSDVGNWQCQAVAAGHQLAERYVGEDELTDEEAAAATVAATIIAVWFVPRTVWNEYRHHGRTGELLELLQRCQGDTLGCWLVRPADELLPALVT
jgi:hypothetical protein